MNRLTRSFAAALGALGVTLILLVLVILPSPVLAQTSGCAGDPCANGCGQRVGGCAGMCDFPGQNCISCVCKDLDPDPFVLDCHCR